MASLHPNEAVVPLSGNRSIPVQIQDKTAASEIDNSGRRDRMSTVNIAVNLDASDPHSFRRSRNQIDSELGRIISRAQRNIRV